MLLCSYQQQHRTLFVSVGKRTVWSQENVVNGFLVMIDWHQTIDCMVWIGCLPESVEVSWKPTQVRTASKQNKISIDFLLEVKEEIVQDKFVSAISRKTSKGCNLPLVVFYWEWCCICHKKSAWIITVNHLSLWQNNIP